MLCLSENASSATITCGSFKLLSDPGSGRSSGMERP
jgi:hypothetical protein